MALPSRRQPRLRIVPGILRLLRFAVVGLALAGCGGLSRADATGALEALFPTLGDYQVTRFFRTEDCEYVVYERGAFVTEPASPLCSIDHEGPADRKRIDDEVRGDLDAIYRASEAVGARLQHAFPEYSRDGTIVAGTFGFNWCVRYRYEPAWQELPSADSEKITAVNENWYEIDCSL